ncbi:MAG: acetyltransferase [Cytophagales bacterium]|nr:acetyltransferase [Cytophagales bacterium]
MILYGASGHAKVVIDCIFANKVDIKGIFDDNPDLVLLNDIKVIGVYQHDHLPNEKIIISIGDNLTRKEVSQKVKHNFGKAIHPSAIISEFAQIDDGTVIFHRSIVQSGCSVGKHCILNTMSSIDHDCVLEDFVHISPNAVLCGNAKVGEGTLIGAGASVIPGIHIGKWCVIGAGAAIIDDVPDNTVVVGVPGRIVKK